MRDVTRAYHVSTVLSIALFLTYGVACLLANGVAAEFKRFVLSQFRRLTGSLEVHGPVELLVGCKLPVIQLLSALPQTLLMRLSVVTRLHVRASIRETMPAAVLLLVNVYVGWYVWQSRLLILIAVIAAV